MYKCEIKNIRTHETFGIYFVKFLQTICYLDRCDWVRDLARARNLDLVLEIDRKYNLKIKNLKNNAYHTKSILRATFDCCKVVFIFSLARPIDSYRPSYNLIGC